MLKFREHLERLEEYQTPVYGHGLPEVSRTGKVVYLNDQSDPITIRIRDDRGYTQLFLGYDALRRMQRRPELGDLMTVTFLRHPGDTRQTETSTVIRAVIH